ncbi:cytosolic carboxypeptidase 2 [Echinococcus multilocularis]|uniref:Cytosolic carboxypeptidase 2 n=1 Tax=Echinococcus multilocularis TaxID=6211 RepID=A0A087W2L9_ECHMU|nr:cytosolic carboxypeptidase 2 [Echinococcus multilocularis]
MREKVLSKLEHLFVRRPMGEVEDNVAFKQPIVVFDTDSSPPMEVRIRRADVLKEEGQLIFESRFESGNLKQARRIGTYEYELVLTPDLVAESHVQWYFFQVAGAQCGVEYTFRIVNLLKSKRLVKIGEKILFHSKKLASKTGNGWTRVGTDSSYGRNLRSEKNPILKRGTTYYELIWKMVGGDVIFCDFHGHSQAFNAFIYGTDSKYRSVSVGGPIEPLKTYLTNPKQYLVDRMIPFLISKQPWREGCARISLWRLFKLTHCFTMETSLFGTNLEPGSSLRYFDRGDLQALGQSVVLALLEFHKIQSNETRFTETLIEMGKAMLQEMMLNRIAEMRTKSSLKSSKPGQLEINKELENTIDSVDDFASAFYEYGDLLVEGEEVESSSASDASSIRDVFITEESQNMEEGENYAPVMQRKRRRRKHRKCRRRRRNRGRRLAHQKSTSENKPKAYSQSEHQPNGPIESGRVERRSSSKRVSSGPQPVLANLPQNDCTIEIT